MITQKVILQFNTALKQKIELFTMMKHHRKLAEERDLSFNQNNVAKYIVWLGVVFGLIYLCFLAIIFSLLVNNTHAITSIEFICSISPFVLVVDFLFRLTMQQVPAQIVKPYILLPIPRYTCIDNFIALSLLKGANFVWLALIVPYLLMSVVFCKGILLSLAIIIFYTLLIAINSQWYIIVRTLANKTIYWWLVPIVVFGFIALPWYTETKHALEHFFYFYAVIGTMIEEGSPLPYLIAILILVLLIRINRGVQYQAIMTELMPTEQVNSKKLSSLSFFERYGEVGIYLQLEIKSIIRNKNPRKAFATSTALVLIFSILLAFTDIYDSTLSTTFFGFYNFVVFGATSLTRIMQNEGNYIDCLMVRKENILSLLKAKYLFYTTILIIPFLLMLPMVYLEKLSFLQLCSYALFTAGMQYFILFQLAVYNKQSTPLNTKLIANKGGTNNYRQILISMGCLFVPIAIISILRLLLNEVQIYAVLCIVGCLFILTNPLWLNNIYKRMMQRRYKLLEGFLTSR